MSWGVAVSLVLLWLSLFVVSFFGWRVAGILTRAIGRTSATLGTLSESTQEWLSRIDGKLYALQRSPRIVRILCIGEDERGGRWAWGETVELAPGEVRHHKIHPQVPLKPGVLVGAFGERARLTGIYQGQEVLPKWIGDGLFAVTSKPFNVGAVFTFELRADK